jgi:hypothetical protein
MEGLPPLWHLIFPKAEWEPLGIKYPEQPDPLTLYFEKRGMCSVYEEFG